MDDINTTPSRTNSNAGWIVAVLILLLLLIGGYFAFARMDTTTDMTTDQMNMNMDMNGMQMDGGPSDTTVVPEGGIPPESAPEGEPGVNPAGTNASSTIDVNTSRSGGM